MREYKIFKTNLGYGVYRKKTVGKIVIVHYLNGNNNRVIDKGSARTFYNQDDAIGALVVMKKKGEKPEDTSLQDRKGEEEKTSWSEL